MDLRIEFAMKAISCGNFGQLCREYGISRKTGYKWRERFVTHGVAGMVEESRRPHRHPEELSERIVCEIIRLKEAHRHWGPKKIRWLYERQHPGAVPSESSFKRVLKRAGLVQPRQRRRAKEGGRLGIGRQAMAPNEVWTVDFKGWWYDPQGQRVEPLSVRDEYSRMILDLRSMASARTEVVRACFERLFERYGLPGAIRSDNGPPFASTRGLMGLSRLSAWWVALGIDLERGRPGSPQDNAAHERMHLDISRELERGRMGRDQAAFDLWARQFNTERPHEALGMIPPSQIYRPSDRAYQGTPDELDYEGMDTRKVHSHNGTIRYRNQTIALSSALGRWNVGLSPQEDGLVAVHFGTLRLGHIDPRTAAFSPAWPSRPGADSATLHRPPGGMAKKRAMPPQPCNP